MNEFKYIAKKKILNLVDFFPFGHDIFLLLTKNRRAISYRGVFDSFEQARMAVPVKKPNNYDVINTNKNINKFLEKEHLDDWFHHIDYPLLYWLSKVIRTEGSVLELGGSVGHFFYSIQKFKAVPQKFRWRIAELSEAVKLGREIAEWRQEDRLSFVDSNDISMVEPVDVFMTAGTLQYINVDLADILHNLTDFPKHVLIHNLPVHGKKSFYTLQNLGLCEVPYRVYSKSQFVNSLYDLGYLLEAEWLIPRDIEIPFYRNLVIMGYHGFYFKKEA